MVGGWSRWRDGAEGGRMRMVEEGRLMKADGGGLGVLGAGGGCGGGGVPVPSPAARPLADAAGARRCSWPTSHLHGNCPFRCPRRTKPCLCLCLCTADGDREGDNGGEAAPGSGPHSRGTGGQTPLRTPSPVAVTCGSGCCTLSCASISSLSICSSREARIWVGKAGVREGWDPHGAPPAPPRAGTGLGESPELGARGQKWGAWGWV